MPRNLEVDENPMRAIAQLLGTIHLAAAEMQETIKLMDVPINRWKVRQLAMAHAKDLEEETKNLMQVHANVCRRLKEIGY